MENQKIKERIYSLKEHGGWHFASVNYIKGGQMDINIQGIHAKTPLKKEEHIIGFAAERGILINTSKIYFYIKGDKIFVFCPEYKKLSEVNFKTSPAPAKPAGVNFKKEEASRYNASGDLQIIAAIKAAKEAKTK